MTSWYSNLLTKTSSQISNLRSTLLSSEADGDTEDDTHVCRVLRNYYTTEKGRPLPAWLPPDPKASAQQAPAQALYAQPQAGSRYGAAAPGGQQQPQSAAGFGSLWDNNPAPQQQAAPQSLRAGRAGHAAPGGAPGGGGNSMGRPAPGQRTGSFPNSGGAAAPPAAAAGGSAQDRLRQRLWGARTTSPGSQAGPFQPPASGHAQSSSGGSGNYEDRFAPGGSYDTRRSGGSGGGGEKPFMGANAPWSTGDDFSGGYSAGGGGGGGGQRGQRGYR